MAGSKRTRATDARAWSSCAATLSATAVACTLAFGAASVFEREQKDFDMTYPKPHVAP